MRLGKRRVARTTPLQQTLYHALSVTDQRGCGRGLFSLGQSAAIPEVILTHLKMLTICPAFYETRQT